MKPLHIVRLLPENPQGLYHRKSLLSDSTICGSWTAEGYRYVDAARPCGAMRCSICFHPDIFDGWPE